MISSIEIRSKTNKPGTGIPTSRRIFVNGQEVYGVRDITVKNKAGQYIDFLDVSSAD
jgi:glutaredoxin